MSPSNSCLRNLSLKFAQCNNPFRVFGAFCDEISTPSLCQISTNCVAKVSFWKSALLSKVKMRVARPAQKDESSKWRNSIEQIKTSLLKSVFEKQKQRPQEKYSKATIKVIIWSWPCVYIGFTNTSLDYQVGTNYTMPIDLSHKRWLLVRKIVIWHFEFWITPFLITKYVKVFCHSILELLLKWCTRGQRHWLRRLPRCMDWIHTG